MGTRDVEINKADTCAEDAGARRGGGTAVPGCPPMPRTQEPGVGVRDVELLCWAVRLCQGPRSLAWG